MFLRPVKSRILFEQMIGRGTRKGDKFPDKSHFVVFDCFGGSLLEYFRNTTAVTAEPPEADGKTIAQIVEEIWQNRDRDYNVRRLVKRLQRVDKQMSGDARELFARYIPAGDVGAFAADLPGRIQAAFMETMHQDHGRHMYLWWAKLIQSQKGLGLAGLLPLIWQVVGDLEVGVLPERPLRADCELGAHVGLGRPLRVEQRTDPALGKTRGWQTRLATVLGL